jgi:hypothetical protein
VRPYTKEQRQSASGEWDLKDPYYRQMVHPQPGYTAEQLEKWYGVGGQEEQWEQEPQGAEQGQGWSQDMLEQWRAQGQ